MLYPCLKDLSSIVCSRQNKICLQQQLTLSTVQESLTSAVLETFCCCLLHTYTRRHKRKLIVASLVKHSSPSQYKTEKEEKSQRKGFRISDTLAWEGSKIYNYWSTIATWHVLAKSATTISRCASERQSWKSYNRPRTHRHCLIFFFFKLKNRIS